MKNIFSLIGRTFIRAAKMEIAINGFKATEICLLNPSLFSKKDFAASSRHSSSKETG